MSLSRQWIALLVACLITGPLAGILVNQQLLVKYSAVQNVEAFVQHASVRDKSQANTRPAAAVQPDDLKLFRRIIQQVYQSERFGEFTANKPDTEIVTAARRQLSKGESRDLQFAYNFGIIKNDLRDLPESVAKEFGGQFARGAVDGGVNIFVAKSEPDAAQSMARLLGEYVEDIALRLLLARLG